MTRYADFLRPDIEAQCMHDSITGASMTGFLRPAIGVLLYLCSSSQILGLCQKIFGTKRNIVFVGFVPCLICATLFVQFENPCILFFYVRPSVIAVDSSPSLKTKGLYNIILRSQKQSFKFLKVEYFKFLTVNFFKFPKCHRNVENNFY